MSSKSVSVKEVLDSSPFSGYQIFICFLCFCLTFFDGFDLSLVGLSLPKIAEFLHSSPPALGFAMAAGNIGALVGAFLLGTLADKFGRKKMLLASAFVFGIFTISIALVDSVGQLAALRFLAGVGLGGAVPNALAFGSEYAPSNKRATLATTMYAGVAVGGVVAGLSASYLLPKYGWQSMFILGGIVACFIGFIAMIFLPETIEFLVQKEKNPTRVRKIVSRISTAYSSADISFVSSEKKLPGAPVKNLFKEGRALSTVLLWLAFILSYYLLWLILSWAPTLLKKSGATPQQFTLAFACINRGSVIATVTVGILIDKFSPFNTIKIGFFLAFLSVMFFGFVASNPFIIVAVMSVVMGFFVIGSNSGLMGLTTISYPSEMRGTGLGWATGIGRIGSLLAPIAGGFMLSRSWSVNRICTSNAILALVVVVIIFILHKVRRSIEKKNM